MSSRHRWRRDGDEPGGQVRTRNGLLKCHFSVRIQERRISRAGHATPCRADDYELYVFRLWFCLPRLLLIAYLLSAHQWQKHPLTGIDPERKDEHLIKDNGRGVRLEFVVLVVHRIVSEEGYNYII